jgi:VWFA-related protein
MLTHTRLAIALLSTLFATAGIAQQEATPTPADNAIYLDVVVTPKSGPPVSGLEQKDFTILDNKDTPPITSFRAFSGPNAPVEVILFIDAVNSGYTTIAYERSEIDRFLRANGGHLAHPMKLAIFGDTGTQIQQSYSTDGNAIATSLDQQTVALRSITRSAGFYGGVDRFQLSMRTLDQLTQSESSRPGRKIILWVSPGWPLLTGPAVQLDEKQEKQIFNSIVETSTRLRQARITIYNINPVGAAESTSRTFYYEQFIKGVTKPHQANIGNLGLQVLAVQTGGLVLNSSNDISAMLQQCFADANAWYELSFQPTPSEPNEYHQIQVRVDKPGLVARTRTGYYSQP